MYNKKLTLETLLQIEESLLLITKRTQQILSVDDFYLSDMGMILLDSICMKLIAIGESVKNIDKITNKELFLNYPVIPWKEVMGLRDIIVHHYFDVDAEEIFKTLKQDVPMLTAIISQIIKDLQFAN